MSLLVRAVIHVPASEVKSLRRYLFPLDEHKLQLELIRLGGMSALETWEAANTQRWDVSGDGFQGNGVRVCPVRDELAKACGMVPLGPSLEPYMR